MTKNNAQSERHAGAASPWLFPGESDGHKTKTTLPHHQRDPHPSDAASVSPLGRGVRPGERPGQLRVRASRSRSQEPADHDQLLSAAQKPAEPKGPRSTGVAKGRSRNLADGA